MFAFSRAESRAGANPTSTHVRPSSVDINRLGRLPALTKELVSGDALRQLPFEILYAYKKYYNSVL